MKAAWKQNFYSNSEWRIGYVQPRKFASLNHLFQFIAISNSAIINESVNTAQLISYLHHLYTLFIIIRGFALRAFRTLDWTRTPTFWAVSGFWLTKTGHLPLRYRNQQICLRFATMYNAAKTEHKHKYTFDPDLRWLPVTFVLLFMFLSLELHMLHTYIFLNSSWRPIF